MASGSRFGTLRGDLPFHKDAIDFLLTRFPRLYLAVERHRSWTNWDKRVYLSFIRPGDVVLDVGANVGAHTVFFSHLVEKRGRVISFEPIPDNLAALHRLVARRSRFDNVTVVETAVGNPAAPGAEIEIGAPAGDLTQASLRPQKAGSWRASSDVRTFVCRFSRLDETEELTQLPGIDFLKVDVEGGELDVLKGAARMIKKHRPLIYCEVYERWTSAFGYSPATLLSHVASFGYQHARVISGGAIHRLRLAREAPEEWFDSSADVLFFTDDDSEAVARFDERYGVMAGRWG